MWILELTVETGLLPPAGSLGVSIIRIWRCCCRHRRDWTQASGPLGCPSSGPSRAAPSAAEGSAAEGSDDRASRPVGRRGVSGVSNWATVANARKPAMHTYESFLPRACISGLGTADLDDQHDDRGHAATDALTLLALTNTRQQRRQPKTRKAGGGKSGSKSSASAPLALHSRALCPGLH